MGVEYAKARSVMKLNTEHCVQLESDVNKKGRENKGQTRKQKRKIKINNKRLKFYQDSALGRSRIWRMVEKHG